MINKKEFDLLLKEILTIENKIVEVKVLNQFDKANEYESKLEKIREKAKDIVLDTDNKSEGFDEISLQILSEMINLNSDIDYYILKTNNIIESANENKIDAETLEKIRKSWEDLQNDIRVWNSRAHNPVEEMTYTKHIGQATLDNIIYQLQKEGVLDFTKVFKCCKKEFLVNALKETLFEGAKNELNDKIRKQNLIDLAKKVSEKDLYNYKLWQQILMIKNVRSRDDHLEIIGNLQENAITYTKEDSKSFSDSDNNGLDIYKNKSLFERIFSSFSKSISQNRMDFLWATEKGPAFKLELEDGNIEYAKEYLERDIIENTKKITIATNGIASYNLDKNSSWKKLEKIEFLEEKNASNIKLSPDKTYACIGKDCFTNCEKLKEISFGKIEMIGERAFKNCTNITEITFSKSIINLGEDAFLGCKNLTKVTFLGDLKLYILGRPQNILSCFKETNLEEITFHNIESASNMAITVCPNLKNIKISDFSSINIPFKVCKYRVGRQDGIVAFVGENALTLWKKKNSNVRFFELTEEDKRKFNIS